MKYHVTPEITTGKKEDRPLRGGGAVSNSTLVSSSISQQTVFEVYPQTVKIKRPFRVAAPTPPSRNGQGLQGFSEKSRSRLRFTAANSSALLSSQFCCTYHDCWPIDGRQFKRHLNAFLTSARRAFPFFAYLWVGEFQTRGAPHAHVFLNVPATDESRHKLAEIWCRLVDKNDPQLLAFHRHPNNMIAWEMRSGSYLCKYLDKAHQKAIPDGFRNFGRWWGNSRGLVPDPDVITGGELQEDLPQVDEETGEIHDLDAVKFLIRTVGRHHERKNKRSWFRRTNRSTSSLMGAPIFRQALEYLERSRGQTIEESSPF